MAAAAVVAVRVRQDRRRRSRARARARRRRNSARERGPNATGAGGPVSSDFSIIDRLIMGSRVPIATPAVSGRPRRILVGERPKQRRSHATAFFRCLLRACVGREITHREDRKPSARRSQVQPVPPPRENRRLAKRLKRRAIDAVLELQAVYSSTQARRAGDLELAMQSTTASLRLIQQEAVVSGCPDVAGYAGRLLARCAQKTGVAPRATRRRRTQRRPPPRASTLAGPRLGGGDG